MSLLDAPFPQPAKTVPHPGAAAFYGKAVIPAGSPFVRDSVGTLFDLDCAGFCSIEVELQGTFASAAISLEESLDGSSWFNVPAIRASDLSLLLFSTASGQRFFGDLGGRRVRLRLAAIGSGAVIANVVLHTDRRNYRAIVAGTVPDGSAVSGYPVRVGGRAVSSSPTVLANGQTGDVLMTLDRRLLTIPDALPENTWAYAAASGGITDTAAVTLKTAAATGLRNYLRGLQIFNAAAVASEIAVRDGSGGTVLWRGRVPASMLKSDSIVFSPPLRGTAATLLEAVMGTTGTQTYINAQGYIAP